MAALQLAPEDQARFQAAVEPVRRHGTVRLPLPGSIARHNLSVAISSFIDREEELVEIAGWLAGARLLTLTGVGGCGKTRLALEVDRAVLANYPDGVWLVDLGQLADAACRFVSARTLSVVIVAPYLCLGFEYQGNGKQM